jgi:hypothetical protein
MHGIISNPTKQKYIGEIAYLIKQGYTLEYSYDDKYFEKTITHKPTKRVLTCFINAVTLEVSYAGDISLKVYFDNELSGRLNPPTPDKYPVILVKYPTLEDLKFVRLCTLNTVGKELMSSSKADYNWIAKLVKAEHSPTRELIFGIKMQIPYWVSVHFTRHHVGVNHYVETQRTDRTGDDRTVKSQNEIVSHVMVLNAQALINMAHKRLCKQASPETREVMKEIVKEVIKVAPYMKDVLVPLCVYRNGKCTEMFSCKGVEE